MTSPFTCYLCIRAGRESGRRSGYRGSGHCVICEECMAAVVARGQRWCNYGRHVVLAADYHHVKRRCLACASVIDRICHGYPIIPYGFVRLIDEAERLRIPYTTLYGWIRRGWDVETMRSGDGIYIKRMDRYPPPPNKRRKQGA